jgi:hypothetical protein
MAGLIDLDKVLHTRYIDLLLQEIVDNRDIITLSHFGVARAVVSGSQRRPQVAYEAEYVGEVCKWEDGLQATVSQNKDGNSDNLP